MWPHILTVVGPCIDTYCHGHYLCSHTHTHTHTHTVLAQMLALDGHYITKETVQNLVSACDRDPSPVNMETLFRQEPYCSMEYFERWIKSHTNLASFSKWFLEEKETGFQLEAGPDPPTFYQTLADLHGCE